MLLQAECAGGREDAQRGGFGDADGDGLAVDVHSSGSGLNARDTYIVGVAGLVDGEG